MKEQKKPIYGVGAQTLARSDVEYKKELELLLNSRKFELVVILVVDF